MAKGTVELSDEFSTSWNPQNTQTSAIRSRHFAIKGTLSWIVDSIDAYFTLANRTPKLIQDAHFISDMDGTEQSVSKKLDCFKNNVDCLLVEYALVKLAITWRNRLVHHFAENELSEEVREILSDKNNIEYITNEYRGLNISEMLGSFDSSFKAVPKFKEITSFVSASVRFITEIDTKLLEKLNLDNYLDEIIYYFIMGDSVRGFKIDKKSRLTRLNSIWTKDYDIKIKKLLNVYQQYGCTMSKDHPIIAELASLTAKKAKIKFNLE